MNATEFAKSIVEGSGGLNDFERYEMVVFHETDRVIGAIWAMRCLANPDCEGSEEALQAILARRGRWSTEKGAVHSDG